jgi:hypothetical protein
MSFSKLMSYLTGVDVSKARELKRLEILQSAARNAEVHDFARQQMRRSNTALAQMLRFLDMQQAKKDRRPGL